MLDQTVPNGGNKMMMMIMAVVKGVDALAILENTGGSYTLQWLGKMFQVRNEKTSLQVAACASTTHG